MSSLGNVDIILKAVELLKDYQQGCHIIRDFRELSSSGSVKNRLGCSICYSGLGQEV